MARSIKEWVGETDDTKIPHRVKTRILDRADHRCKECGARIYRGGEIDHVIRLKDWRSTTEAPHGNRESNLQLLCKPCHAQKSGREATAGAKVERVKQRNAPIRQEKTYWSKQYALAKARGWNPWGKR
jgi:5-methylcytosine-specific restriction protein A